MRPNQASKTAGLVAFLRACGDLGLSTVPGYSDPTAQALMTPPFDGYFRWIKRAARVVGPKRLANLVRERRLDSVPLRTMAIDAALREALALGATQLVMLGAGLDGRAHRMDELADVTVFEVDHPSTQAEKKKRAQGLPKRCKDLRYVSVDFEREDVASRLAEAGHEPKQRSVFIWEGVIVYLTDQALRATLQSVVVSSAPGSRLLAQYRQPSTADEEARLQKMVAKMGEPHIGPRTPAQLAQALQEVGLRVLSDTSGVEWAFRFGATGQIAPTTANTRLVVGERS